jgi:hypothetical protein
MTAGSSMQAMTLTCPAQRSQVSMGPPPDRSGCGPIEHPLASPTPFSRRDTHTKFAVRREAAPSENPMKTSKIYAWLGYKGG